MVGDLFKSQGKRCPRCGNVREWFEFGISLHSSDGLQSYCKDCKRKYRKLHPMKEYKKGKKDMSLEIWENPPLSACDNTGEIKK